MIVFVPAYDDATEANLAIAQQLPVGASRQLFAEDATRARLRDALRTPGTPLFTMTHGRPGSLRAQGGETALSNDDVSIVGSRTVYAFACHTATSLGAKVAEHGGTWWGYTGAIQCPDVAEAPALSPLFVAIFGYILESFASASTSAARRAVIEQIAQRCEDAQALIDAHALADPSLDVAPAYYCLLHLWDRLRVWASGADAPEQHPDARPPSLFLASED